MPAQGAADKINNIRFAFRSHALIIGLAVFASPVQPNLFP
jgi:hypothetical protein